MRSIVFAIAAAVLGCNPAPPAGRPPVPADDYDRVVEENAALRERIVELEAAAEQASTAELAAPVHAPGTLGADVAALRGQAAACEGRLSAAIAARDRYEDGVNRCVEELNRAQSSRRIGVGSGSGAPAPPASTYRPPTAASPAGPRAPPPPSSPPRTLRPVRTLSAPDVQIVGDDILVSARLWNPEDSDQHVTIEIALLADGVVQKQETQDHLVPAGGDLAVSARFHSYGTYEGKTLTGRVRPLR